MKDPFAPWVVALTHTGFGSGLPLSGRDWWPLFDPPPTTPAEIEARMARSPNPAVRPLFDRRAALEPELEALESEGIVALTMFDKTFPQSWSQRLGPRIPPVAFLLGDAEILRTPSVALVGSRDADEAALEFTVQAARAAVERGKSIVTGGANGVDRAAVAAAVRAGGSAIVIAADSFEEVQGKLLRSDIDLDQVLLATPSHPTSGWSVGKAMGRNKLIYALAEVAIVAACEANTGGTWAGAAEALKMAYCPVCAWTGEGAAAGNLALVEEGATAIANGDDAFEPNVTTIKTSLFD